MIKRTCYHCGKEYAVLKDDALIVYHAPTSWLHDVCKRCACYLNGYHKWTITDDGLRLCAACFKPRHSLGNTILYAAMRRKRDAVPPG